MLRIAALLTVFVLITGSLGMPTALAACPAFPASIPDGDTAALIEAITCANATPDDDVIELATNGTYTFTTFDNISATPLPAPYNIFTVGANAMPAIDDAAAAGTLTIAGNNAALWVDVAAPNMRFFYVVPGGDLTLNALSLLLGRAEVFGGAILNAGMLRATGVAFDSNQALVEPVFNFSIGGALLNIGTAVVDRGYFATNHSAGQGGAIANGLANSAPGVLTVTRTTFEINRSAQGGGIYTTSGSTALIQHSRLTNNSTSSGSGAALFLSGGTMGTMTVTDSLIDNNTTNDSLSPGVRGGAIFIGSGTLALVNSTISANVSNGESGGGLHVQGGNVAIRHSTIVKNVASVRGGGIGSTLSNAHTITLENTLIADNVALSEPDVDARVTSNGYTLIGDSTGAVITGGVGDLLDAAASPLNLDVLADNGGATFTHLPLPGSVAIDAGNPSHSISDEPLWDQRGEPYARAQGRRLDIGAAESSGGYLDLTLTQQGHGTPPNAAHVITAVVELRPLGGGPAILSEPYSTNTSGVVTLGDLPIGTHTLWVKGTHTLALTQPVTLSQGGNTAATSALREGDADDNNVVNIIDFSVLAAAFGRASETPGFDPRADFNEDDFINITDFSLLALNFGQLGAP